MSIQTMLQLNPYIPVISSNSIDEANDSLNKLRINNIKIVEFTLRTPNAFDVIEEIIKSNNDFIIGVGTILTLDQLKKATLIGADFLVSPGMNISLLEYARDHDLPYLPGAVTPSEIMTVSLYNFNIIKFFPSEAMGGVSMLKNYKSVFPNIQFCATGGINASNQEEYLAEPNIIAIGSSSLI